MAIYLSDIPGLLKDAAYQWAVEDNTFQHGAAISYYAVFAVSPLIVLAVVVAGLLFGEQAAQGELANQLESATDPVIASAIEEIVEYAHQSGGVRIATGVSIAVLLIGATGFFAQLQASLNFIWGVRHRTRGLWGLVRDRLWCLLMVLLASLLLLTSLTTGWALHQVREWVGTPDLGQVDFWRTVHWVLSLGMLTLLFGFIYKVLPDVIMPWRIVWPGAFITALLFRLGNYLIGLYFTYSSPASAFGAAGSLVVLLAWVYYSSQIVLFGAEVTEAYAIRARERVEPSADAIVEGHRPGQLIEIAPVASMQVPDEEVV